MAKSLGECADGAWLHENIAGKMQCFLNAFRRHRMRPRRTDFIPRLPSLHCAKNLPHHDTGALKSRLAVADVRISYDIFPKLDGLLHVLE